MTAADTIREALVNGSKDWLAADRALNALEAVARAARHYLDGTDPDGYLNLRAALERLERTQ